MLFNFTILSNTGNTTMIFSLYHFIECYRTFVIFELPG